MSVAIPPPAGQHEGFCEGTADGEGAACGARDAKGSWGNVSTLHECRARCAGCGRCRYLSFSLFFKECSWFYECDLAHLKYAGTGHVTYQVGPWHSGPRLMEIR